MTLSSVPITLSGKDYHLRYTYPDFKAMENLLGIGYLHFFRSEIFNSLTAMEVFLLRGLKKEMPDGGFVSVFSLDEIGREQAGNLLWSYLQDGGDVAYVIGKIVEAFTTTGPFKKKEKDDPEKEPPKNSMA